MMQGCYDKDAKTNSYKSCIIERKVRVKKCKNIPVSSKINVYSGIETLRLTKVDQLPNCRQLRTIYQRGNFYQLIALKVVRLTEP